MSDTNVRLMNLPGSRLQHALGLAVALHLLLAVLVPGIPELVIPAIDRGKGITVFLRQTPEPEPFQQNLNSPGNLANDNPDELQPSAGVPATRSGDAQSLSDRAPQVDSDRRDRYEATPSGEDSDTGLTPQVFITRSAIKIFAQQEAFMFAERNSDRLERFKRSFRSYASYRRRPSTESYADIYGDYYVRTSSSEGDICFLQQKEQSPDDFSTNTVYFYRCGREPQNFSQDAP